MSLPDCDTSIFHSKASFTIGSFSGIATTSPSSDGRLILICSFTPHAILLFKGYLRFSRPAPPITLLATPTLVPKIGNGNITFSSPATKISVASYTTLILSGTVISIISDGVISNDTTCAPGIRRRTTPSINRNLSSGFERAKYPRYALSLIPPKSNTVSHSISPSAVTLPVVFTCTILLSAGSIGDVSRVSPSGRATR